VHVAVARILTGASNVAMLYRER